MMDETRPEVARESELPAICNCSRTRLTVACIVIVLLVGSVIKWRIMPMMYAERVLRTEEPTFRLDWAAVPPCPLEAVGPSLDELTAVWNFTVVAENPNDKKELNVYFEELQASLILYGVDRKRREKRTTLATAPLRPFSVGKKNETSMSFRLSMTSEYAGGQAQKALIINASSSDPYFCWAGISGSTSSSAGLGLKLSGFYTYKSGNEWVDGRRLAGSLCQLSPPRAPINKGQFQSRPCPDYSASLRWDC